MKRLLTKSICILSICAILLLGMAGIVFATDCWDYDSNQTGCIAQADCKWEVNPGWSGCVMKGCWNFWTQDTCSQSNNESSTVNYINKSCSWQSGTSSGWCMNLDCWAFDGNKTACTTANTTYGMQCEWTDVYNEATWDYPCMGPPEKDCWSQKNTTACTAITGCKWGMCMKESCWDFSDDGKTTCESHTGFSGKSCVWKVYSDRTECMEQSCWNYGNKTACEASNCTWDGSCMEMACGNFAGKNASYCLNNTANLTCNWNNADKHCTGSDCGSYGQSTCNSVSGCFFETYTGGWCEEQMCWQWDNQNEANCTNTTLHPGLSCVWNDPWCFENMTAQSCGSLTNERDCMDTMYCWWNFTGETCNDPESGGATDTDFKEFNPGCYIFDMSQNVCTNTTGCYWDATLSECEHNTSEINKNELNCSLLNNQTVCNNIPMLSTCCKWQGTSCAADRLDQSCRKQMEEPPEGGYYCEDYVALTDNSTCLKIAGSPWYMPCQWNSTTLRCEFKKDDIFGVGEKNIMKLDNEKNCVAAGGKWLVDTYPSTNNASTAVRKSIGRCDYNFDDERNCDKECFACEYKSDKTNWSSAKKARKACSESKLGICGFTDDTTAPNGYGHCGPKDEFKKGIAKDCRTDCGSCTFMGNPTASEKFVGQATGGTATYNVCMAPSCYCGESAAKCKWVEDPAHKGDETYGMCVSATEMTCEKKCDKCYSESNCNSYGGKKGNESAAPVCKWDSGICEYKSNASQMEICYNFEDDNRDNKIDCADSMCYSDPFCGGAFMFDSFGVDCFLFDDETSCVGGGCAWVNEGWGSWCDMPMAVCWKKDGTNESYCQGAISTNETLNISNVRLADNHINETYTFTLSNLGSGWVAGSVAIINTSGTSLEENYTVNYAAQTITFSNNTFMANGGGSGNLTNISYQYYPASLTCEWHSGFGGFCEQDWEMGGGANACFANDDNKTACALQENCTWVVDTWCTNVGGTCEQDEAGSATYGWKLCDDLYGASKGWENVDPAACDADGSCWWKPDSWCTDKGNDSGMCDHKSFACWQNNDNESCVNATNYNDQFCVWQDMGGWCDCTWAVDSEHPNGCTVYCSNYSYGKDVCQGYNTSGCEWRTDSKCKGKMMGGGTDSCWNQQDEATCGATSGCNWVNGLCDPPGFGGDMMMGMPGGMDGGAGMGMGGGGPSMSMGGSGMQCMKYDGNQTLCENTTGCGWFNEKWPFCDINFQDNCPMSGYNRSVCNALERCKWNNQSNFCDEKPFECFWNQTLNNQSNLAACGAHPLCYNDTNTCQPVAFNATTQSQCLTYNATLFRWMNGWCNPAMASQMFKDMEFGGGAPPIPLGSDADDSNTTIADEIDIISFSLKDMGPYYGFGVTVDDPLNSAGCNDIKMTTGKGQGTNTAKFYWYLDTDGDSTNNCNLRHNSSLPGYEFLLQNSWGYDSSSGTVTEAPRGYICTDGSWEPAEIKITSQRNIMCTEIQGAGIGIDKADLNKYPHLYTTGIDIRVVVASADATHNSTSPVDTAEPGWVTPGTQDFELPDMHGYETDAIKKVAKEAASGAGFVQYGKEADCWTAAGCAEYYCKGSPYCVENSLGIEASGYVDTRIPKIVGVIKEIYPDSVFIAFFTDKPANGSLTFYKNDSTCALSSLNTTIYDAGITDESIDAYRLSHEVKIFNGTGGTLSGYNLVNDTSYYFKLKVCDDAGKCGESRCTSFTTAHDENCPFCKFVSRINAPEGWNVYYDLDQDGEYEHHQGYVLGNNTNDGMFTNYSSGRSANILMNTSDGTAHIEFIDATLTKSGMSPDIRKINEETDALGNGTDTTAAGETIGYVGMIDDTRDKIVNNLYPKKCNIKIPRGSVDCDELWHCDNDGANCVDRTSNATSIENGTAYCIWEVPCEFSQWSGGEPGTPTTTTTTTSSSSGGSSSSSGGGAAADTSAGVTTSHYYDTIATGTETTWALTKKAIAITKNTFTVNKDISKATITITQVADESSVPEKIENAYQYINIGLENIKDSDVDGATLEFKVEKSWLTENNINEVSLMRYTTAWAELPTEFASSDENYSYYKATTPGFSYFAVVGKKAPEEVISEPVKEEEEAAPMPEEAPLPQPAEEPVTVPEEKETKMLVNGIVIALIILLIAAVVYFIKRRQ